MSTPGNDRSLALMKRALQEIKELRARVDAYEQAAHEPIAVVGMGCRFPGDIKGPDALWQFLLDGRDAIEELPASRDRLQDVASESRPRGSFLKDIDRFDAPFFEISAREANSMDPQQRLLLEVSWETLEHAGIRPSTLRGSRTGVYVGVMTAEYSELLRGAGDIDLHTATGSAPSVIAGRLSHFFGVHGPSLVIDTACSSSLAAVHLACKSLRSGECDQAFAAGLNLLLSTRAYEAERRAGMLASDGRCKTFDARADGIGRGEGVGVVLLRRLSDAIADGNSIVAVIRGSAMNHDGRSSGLTTPSERAQERVLQDALADARVTPGQVGVIEAHGTGTSLGDPVELGALATVFGGREQNRPLLVGAAKANFGHLEGAAGILGLMKAALLVNRGEVPPQLHIQRLNPLIPWSQIPITIPTSRQSYPAGEGLRIAGVSAFGLSGTNVHVVLAQPDPVMTPGARTTRSLHLLAFSARTTAALDAMDAQLRASILTASPERIGDICHTVNTTREQFEHRRAFVVGDEDHSEWRERLEAAADLYMRGGSVDWKQLDAGLDFAHVSVPTYPFEDHRYWVDLQPAHQASTPFTLTRRPVAIAGPARSIFEYSLDASTYLRDHRVHGRVVVPAATFVDLAMRVARELRGTDAFSLRSVLIIRPLMVEDAGDVTLQVVTDHAGNRIAWQIFALDASEWTLHAEGEITASPQAATTQYELSTLKAAHPESIDVNGFYDRCREHGLDYGPAFRSVASLSRGSVSALARIEVPASVSEHASVPVAIDGCLQMLGALVPVVDGEAPFLPIGVEALEIRQALPHNLWCVATPRETHANDSSLRLFDLELLDANGNAIGSMSGVTLRRAVSASFVETIPLLVPEWKALEPVAPSTTSLSGSWVIFRSAGPEGDALASRLRAEGARCSLVMCGGGFDDLGDSVFTIDPAREEDYARVLDAIPGPLRGVVHLWNTAAPDERTEAGAREESLVTGTASALYLAKALLARPRAEQFRFCVLTRGAQAVTSDDGPINSWQAPVWGLLRAAFLEHPELGCRIVDLDPSVEHASAEALLRELHAKDGEEQIAHRRDGRYALRLSKFNGDASAAPVINGAGHYLVTGGLGALGLQVAKWLVARGARHLTLVSRRTGGAETERAIAELRAGGADIRIAHADVSSESDVARLLREIANGGPALRGIIHAAGVLDDHAIVRTTWESCQRVFAPKIEGAWNLHHATRGAELDFFVCFSSAASILGAPGQANYAAANEWLNAFARQRHQLGLPAVSINWGPWAGAGMAAGSAAGEYLTPLSLDRAINALERSIAADVAQVAVLPFTARFHAEFGSSTVAPKLLLELAREKREAPAIAARGLRSTIDVALQVVGDALGRKLSIADAGVSLARLGMDSLMALEIRDGLREQVGIALSVVDVLAIESVNALAGKLDERLGPAVDAPASMPASSEVWPASHGQRSLWFLHGLDPQSAAYHVAFVARVRSEIDTRALESAFNVLTRRHPALNAQFALEDGGLVCRSRPDRGVAFEVIDATGLDEASLQQRVRAAYARPFDLVAGDAPFRVTVLSRAANDHVLLTVAHHIVHDAWSMWLLADELRHVYPAVLKGIAPELPPATRPFADVVRIEQARLASPEGQRLWEFWSGELSALPPAIDLPADHTRPARRTTHGATRSFELPRSLTSSLRELAGSEGATLFNAMLAGFQGLLHRYSAQDDLIVGVPMSGRDEPGFERTVGYFVNAVPMRSRITSSTTFRQMLIEAKRRTRASMANQGMPLSLLIDKLALTHDPSRTPIFQAMFVFQQPQGALELSASDAVSGPTEWGGLSLEAYPGLSQQEGQFDLTLELTDHGDRIAGAWKYSLDLFEAETAERMLAHLQNLIAAAVANPDRPVGELSMLSSSDRHTIVSEWNATDRAYDLETSLPRLLEAQASLTPDATAVAFENETLSYREFDQQTTRLASALRARGVSSGDVVGVYAERSIELVVALCAIVKAGAAYCPLDPSYPADRLAYMISAAGVRTVLTQVRFADAVAGLGVSPVMLDGEQSHEWRDVAAAASLPAIHPDDIAYVIFTSGSTGRPKGVMVSHRAIVNRLRWMQDEYRLTADDAVLQKTTFSFDVSVWEFFWPLMTGARLIVARPEGHRDPSYLAQLIREQAVTVMHFVPSMLAAFVEEPTLSLCTSLRHVICSGEALPGPLCDRFFARSASALHNLYGPTEAAVDVTYWPCDRSQPRASIPIGHPIANIRMHILDADGQPCAIGVPGELMIGGVGLARGYAGRPDLTADRFVPDPLGATGARLYRTGDRSRYLADGAIDFLGRLDHQVKLRGQRIELGEIEAALASHPAVRACAVVVSAEGTSRARLVAHIEASGPASEDELRSHVATRLPESMVPARIVVHQSLPLTASGKVDRRQLPEPAVTQDATEESQPRTKAEQALCAIWAELLNLKTVGIHDNFFALGGDSILGMQMVMRAAQADLNVTVAQFYENQNVAALARIATPAVAVETTRDDLGTRTRPTPIQQWFFERKLKTPHHFNQSVMFEVADGLDANLLKQAVSYAIAHHDALRMIFSPNGDSILAPSFETVSISLVDLTGTAESERREVIEAYASTMQASLDPASGALINVTLYTFGNGVPGRLHFIAHHLAVDGVSWRILLDDVRAVYRQLEQGQTARLPLKTTSYQRWSDRLHEYAASEAIRNDLDFWLRQTPSNSTALFPVGGGDGARVAPRTVSLDVETTTALLGPAQRAYRTRPDDLILTALLQGLQGWTGRSEARIDLEGHGRTAPFDGVDVSRTIGWFTALYPLLLAIGPQPDPDADLKRIKETLRSVPHHGVSYGALRYLQGGDAQAQLAAQPQSEVLFNYLGRLDQGMTGDFLLRLASEATGPLQAAGERAAYALQVDAYVVDGRLFMRWSHDSNRVSADVAEALATRVLDQLRALIAHCASSAARGFTPSDVPAARLDQEQLDRALTVIAAKGIAAESIADLYELSPVQEGMLYHSLAADSGSIYNQRMSVTLRGDLRAADFRAAWQSVLDRHAALRTAFVWEDVAKPLQIVQPQVALPWHDEDWRHKTSEQQAIDLRRRLAEDADRGFDLTRAPLMRCLLIRLKDEVACFCWSHHHILLDGWSFAQILQEVMAVYHRPGTRELSRPGQYRDYVGWLQGRPVVEGRRFWRELLDGFTSPTDLGIERPVPDRAIAHEHREVVRMVDPVLSESLARMARDSHVTLSVVLQAAWAALLQRYSGADDVVFGVTVAGRPADLRDADSTVGLFLNTLPVRIKVSPRQSVRDLLTELMAQQARREAFTFSSLAEIQAAAGLPSGVQLFRSLVVVENYPLNIDAGDAMPGIELRDFQFAEQTNYPLTLVAFPGERLQLKLAYDAQRFSADGVASMLNHLMELLAGMAGGADRAIGGLSLLDAVEMRRVVEDLPRGRVLQFKSKAIDLTPHAALHHMIEEWAARTPDAAALSWSGGPSRLTEAMSYRELDRRSNQLAHRLYAMGVRRGDCVGVLMERTPSMIVALLGILKAGAAYVPCDPAYPDARVQFMLDDTNATVTLCDAHLRSKLSGASSSKVLLTDALASTLADESDAPLQISCGRHDPAYVIYTSGSTGKPKGVVVTHDNVMRLFDQTDHWFSFAADDVWTFFHSVAFDFSVWEIWGALVHGARVAIVPFAMSRSTDEFHRLLIDESVTVLSQTPSAFSQLMLVDEASSSTLALRYVVFGGEALDIRKLGPWFDRHGDVRPQLVNMYGITETTVHVTYRPLIAADAKRVESVVGVPIPDLSLYVLDQEMRPAPVGVPGELHVGGAGLALGYRRRAALTAERFLPDPFSSTPGARLYKTGDQGRFLHDGDAEHLGRIDQQVKLRGFRIELGEIEAALRASDGVADAVVVLAELASGPGLVGYVVPARDSRSIDVDALRASLIGKLPEYMVPSALVALEQLPRTSNGKLDRRALPAPTSPRSHHGERVMPRNEAERRVLEIWRDVLPVGEIGIHDNFFDLGGHSLLLVRVHSRLKSSFGRDFPMVTLFAHPTIHALAGFLGDADEAVPVEAAAAAGHDRGVERGTRQDARSKQRAARERSRRPEVASE